MLSEITLAGCSMLILLFFGIVVLYLICRFFYIQKSFWKSPAGKDCKIQTKSGRWVKAVVLSEPVDDKTLLVRSGNGMCGFMTKDKIKPIFTL